MQTAQSFSLLALARLGDFEELRQRQSSAAREAAERGDDTARRSAGSGTSRSCGWSRTTLPARAPRCSKRWMAGPRLGFHLEHFYELVALTYADLYEGKGAEAHARIREAWPRLGRSHLRLVQSVNILSLELRARTALALAARAGAPERERLLREARAQVRALRGRTCPSPWRKRRCCKRASRAADLPPCTRWSGTSARPRTASMPSGCS